MLLPKDGALKHLDPLWPIRSEMVESLTSKVTGRAKPEKEAPVTTIEKAITQKNATPSPTKIPTTARQLFTKNGRFDA